MSWKLIGKIDRRRITVRDPLGSFAKEVLRQYPKAKMVSDIGVSPATNDWLGKLVTKAIRKKYKGISKSQLAGAVGMEMLMYSPADIDDSEPLDFHIYRRV